MKSTNEAPRDLPPMQEAVWDLMRLFEGLHGTLASIDANRPGASASGAEQAEFMQQLRPLIAEAQLSLSLAVGDLARHLRRHASTLN